MLGVGNDCLKPIYLPIKRLDWCGSRPLNFGFSHFRVPCNHCIACKLRRTREWSLRLILESKDYDFNMCHVTLTYSDVYVPEKYACVDDDGVLKAYKTLSKRDCQLFLKRLRKKVDVKFKYFLVGEYGPKCIRPHYHIVFFGLGPEYFSIFQKVWDLGNVVVKPFFDETAPYISGYVQKKLYGNIHFLERLKRDPEFLLASKRLGKRKFLEYAKQYINDKHPFIEFGGFKYAIPRVWIQDVYNLGLIKDLGNLGFLSNQRKEFEDLKRECERLKCDFGDYFKFRRASFARKQLKAIETRNNTGDI